MFKIDPSTNRISRIESKRFSDLGFRERDHLQEWLANQPDALGEELLIIQKEFDGFDDTRERLDLLALDKERNLVVIENKLDDTGRDVVWQALKYASYCSSLTTSHLVGIYQDYLNRNGVGGDAKERICDFLDTPEFDEIVLNSGNNQRLMMVAANFRKEVTSTALWLLNHGIQVQCIKVTPYETSGELFLNVEQIIPTPEAKELMIGMSAKDAEEKSTEIQLKSRHKLRLKFWAKLLDAMHNSSCSLYDKVGPSKDSWINAGSGLSNCFYTFSFSKKEVRIEFNMARPTASTNKAMFDELLKLQSSIEASFEAPLEWLRMDKKISSKVQYSNPCDSNNQDNWTEIIEWLVSNMTKLEQALKQPIQQVNSQLKSVSVDEKE